MHHRIVGNITGLINDDQEVSDNNPVVIEYTFKDKPMGMEITYMSVYGAYPALLRRMDSADLIRQVQFNITNIEGDNVEFETQTVTIL